MFSTRRSLYSRMALVRTFIAMYVRVSHVRPPASLNRKVSLRLAAFCHFLFIALASPFNVPPATAFSWNAETTAERKAFMTRFVMFSVNTAARFSPWDGERRAQTSSACFLE